MNVWKRVEDSQRDPVDIMKEHEREAADYKERHGLVNRYRHRLWRAHAVFIKEFREFLRREYLDKGITHLSKREYGQIDRAFWNKIYRRFHGDEF